MKVAAFRIVALALAGALAACSAPVHQDFLKNLTNTKIPEKDAVWDMAYHERAQLFAVGFDSGAIHLWDAAKADSKRVLQAHKQTAGWLLFTPEGNILISSAGYRDDRKLWDTQTGKLLKVLPELGGPAHIAPDPSYLLFGGIDGIQIYDLKKDVLLPEQFRLDGVVAAIAVHNRTGQVVIATQSGSIQLSKFSVSNGKPRLEKNNAVRPYETGNWAMNVQFSKSGDSIFVISRRGVLDVWDLPKFQRRHSRKSPLLHIFRAEFSPDNSIVVLSGAADPAGLKQGLVQIVDLSNFSTKLGKSPRHMVVEFIPSLSAMVMSGDDGRIRSYDVSGTPHPKPESNNH